MSTEILQHGRRTLIKLMNLVVRSPRDVSKRLDPFLRSRCFFISMLLLSIIIGSIFGSSPPCMLRQ
jgi:hypothetical protein